MNKQRPKKLDGLVLSAALLAATTLWAAEPASPPAQAGSSGKPEVAKSQAAKSDATRADPSKPDAGAASEPTAKTDASKVDPPAKGDAKTLAAEAAKAAEKAEAAAKGSPQRFIPSEQVRADFDVSFPIDI
jgi:hypothetical protein